jgi:hypothetical protein
MSRKIHARRTANTMLVMLVVVLMVATGCASPSTPEPSTQSPLPSPEPTTRQEPAATATTPISVLPTPDPNWATVTGRLVRAEDGEPVVGVMAFLEQTTEDHTVPPVLYAPPNDQPRARTNENGEFTIAEVPADEYVIILYSPPFALQVVTQSDGDQPLLINTEVGDVRSIGTIRVTEFELP